MIEEKTKVTNGLVKLRRAHGHDTPIGHRASNILEMLDAGTAKPADIARQVRELVNPKGGSGPQEDDDGKAARQTAT